MRCLFVDGNHFAAIVDLTAKSDDDAIRQARSLFSSRTDMFTGFEVWDKIRVVMRYSKVPDQQGRGHLTVVS